jgi:hypothetical protein
MEVATPDVYERAADHWRTRGVSLLCPCSPDEVGATFETLGYPLSADVRRLYDVIGGFADYECDILWSLWSLARLREENAENRDRGELLLFADWLIQSHTYGFHYEDARVSSVYIHDSGERIADSLEAFLETYLSNPDAVWAFHSGDKPEV